MTIYQTLHLVILLASWITTIVSVYLNHRKK